MHWGTLDFTSQEADRPEFKGKPHAFSHIDGKGETMHCLFVSWVL